MQWPWLILAACLVFAATVVLTGFLLPVLRRHAVLDRPNDRSSHTDPTPRGGGLAILAVLLPAWAALAFAGVMPDGFPALLAATLALAVVSWIDDLRGLSPAARIVPQVAAVAATLALWPADTLVFQGLLPLWLDRLLAAVVWLWFLNLFNFMDGIDALAGTEAASIGFGLAAVAFLGGGLDAILPFALMLAAAAAGFLVWNRPPARIFLGDVGSIPLGYLIGWLLLSAAAAGQWGAALILPAYYLADATLTLLRRLAAGRDIFAAHAEHFYQVAVRRRLSHGQAVRAILAANLALIVLAIGAARDEPLVGLIGAAATVALLLRYLARPATPEAG